MAWAGLSGFAHSQDQALPRTGFLQVSEQDCGGGARGEDGVTWPSDNAGEYRLHLSLNSRESILSGPVEIDVTPGKVVAYVPVRVYETKDNEPVATCIRPVVVSLLVTPLARGEYEWLFLRGTRSESLARRAEAEAASARDAGKPQEPAITTDPTPPKREPIPAPVPMPADKRQD